MSVSLAFKELPYAVRCYQALAVKVALRAYAKHKMQVNRAYTPKNMLATASAITGANYKVGDYLKAADDIEKLLEKMKKDEESRIAVARTLAAKSPSNEVH